MDFVVSTDSFQRAVKCLSVVVRPNSVDATGRLLIEAEPDKVSLIANNGNTAIIFTISDAKVSNPGITSIEFNKVKSFIMSFKPWNGETGTKDFRFTLNDRSLEISVDHFYETNKSSNGNLKLPTFNPALITKPQEFTKPDFIINSSIFKTATNKVLYAINPQIDATVSVLQGMNINFDEENICFVGCDGIVLSEYIVKNVTDKMSGSVNLQYDFFMGLRRLLTENIQLFWELKNNKVCVKFNEIMFIGRTVIGQEYPEYKTVLDNYKNQVSFSKDFLMSTLFPLQDVLDAEDNMRITVEIKDKKLRFYNHFANIETDCDLDSDIDLSIDVNGKLLIQSVDAIVDDTILFKFSDGNKPIILDSNTFNDQKALIQPLMRR